MNYLGKWENEDESEQNPQSKHGFFEKFLNIFGFEAEEIIEDEEAASQEGPNRKDPRDRGKLVSLNQSNNQLNGGR